MKLFTAIVAILFLVVSHAHAQSASTTRVHFLNAMPNVNAMLKTSLDQKKPVRIRFRTWVTMRPVNDSLSFVVNDKLYKLYVEPNKQYYFVFETSHFAGVSVTEKSEREFIMMAMLNSAEGPEEIN